ncbi:hypothetical protein BGX28_008321 [Mortierella sp. GBA30]|nr:hypothetical protein BGX28_008321 [Mortierella sp. GBA30]
MDDIRLEDEPLESFEPFEPFDDYEDYADEMMQEAERQDQLMLQQQQDQRPQREQQPHASTSVLPPQRDFLAMLNDQTQRFEQQIQLQSAQQRQSQAQPQTQWQKKKTSAGAASRPIGSAANGAGGDGDLAAVNTTKKRVKLVTLDAEKLLSERGLPLLINHGKRFKIRHKYRDTAEKNANAKQNLADLMRLYQTWAHNLFPKSTFRDFILQAESKCRGRQLKSNMDGWRDAHWQQVWQQKEAALDAERAEQTATDQHTNVWEQHETELSRGSNENTAQDASISAGQNNSNGNSSSSAPLHPLFIATTVSSSQQPRPRPAVSRKGKEKAVADNPSAAMRLAASDDEDDEQDYNTVMSRMRVSMNIYDNTTRGNNGQETSTGESTRRISTGRGLFMHTMEKDEDEDMAVSRKNEIDLDNYNSDVEDEEDEDGEQPLFTHRALKMMGGLSALVSDNKSMTPSSGAAASATVVNTETEGDSSVQDAERSMDMENDSVPAPVELKLSLSTNTQAIDGEDGGGGMHNRVDDDRDMMPTRKPGRTRRVILMDDSDDE